MSKQKSPLIVELVGLAGAGKTTISRALSQHNEKILVAADLELRKTEHLSVFVRHAPFLMPVFLRRCRKSRWFTWDEIKAMVYLRGWPHVLRKQARQDRAAILLDHGPIFKLSTLDAFGPERLKRQEFEKWWNSMFKQWALTLDAIIWLNAPDQILVERINVRGQRHAVKGKSEGEAVKFLTRYQKSYEQILTRSTAFGGPTPLRFDTDQSSIEQLVNEILLSYNIEPD